MQQYTPSITILNQISNGVSHIAELTSFAIYQRLPTYIIGSHKDTVKVLVICLTHLDPTFCFYGYDDYTVQQMYIMRPLSENHNQLCPIMSPYRKHRRWYIYVPLGTYTPVGLLISCEFSVRGHYASYFCFICHLNLLIYMTLRQHLNTVHCIFIHQNKQNIFIN